MGMLFFFIGLLVFLFMVGVPVASSIGLTSLAVLWAQNDLASLPVTLLPLKMMHGVNNFSLLAIPFFIFAANVMCKGSVTTRIFDFANSFVGHLRGGLGHVSVVASMIFAGMSGTAVADAAGLGQLQIKAMTQQGYPKRFAIGLTGSASIIGPIIPPSVGMVVYGWMADVSVGGLFMGGFIPGVILGLALMVTTYILSYRIPMPLKPRPAWSEIRRLTGRGVLSLLTPVIIIGGIWSGIFTPTESGAVASLYAIFLGKVIYRDTSWKDLLDAFHQTIEFTAVVLFIISISVLYGWLLIRLQIPMVLAEWVVGLTSNKYILLSLIQVFFLIVGCFMSVVEAIIIFTPIMVPMIKMLGIDLLYFGVLMVVSMTVGVITPPFGNVLFMLVSLTGETFEEVVRAHLPFLVPIVVVIFTLVFVPEIITFLPGLMEGR